MKENEAEKLLQLLGSKQVRAKSNGWIEATCPFARWNHSGGTDSDPSFGVNVNDGFGFNCLSCGVKGRGAQSLVWRLRSKAGGGYEDAMSFVMGIPAELQSVAAEVRSSDPISSMTKMRGYKKKRRLPKPEQQRTGAIAQSLFEMEPLIRPTRPESDLDMFEPMYHPYLLDRGFSKEIIEKWELMVDVDGRGNERIVFPIRDGDGNLLAFSRRVTWAQPQCQVCGYKDPDGVAKDDRTIKFGSRRNKDELPGSGGCPNCDNRWVWPKYLHSKGFTRNLYLFGEHLVDRSFRKGVIVEGNLDPVRLDQFGVRNAVATLGTNVGTKWPSPKSPGEQLYHMTQMFDEIIVMADGDEAGDKMAESIRSFFKGKEDMMWVQVVKTPRGRDPGDMSKDEIEEILGPYGVLRAK